MTDIPVSLVIFTCTGREHLLRESFTSFEAACDYPFSKIILAIDGQINPQIIDHIKPDVIVQSPERKGYVNSIMRTLNNIDSDYYFWLEDDWKFHDKVNIRWFVGLMQKNKDWAEMILSKFGPLTPEFKVQPIGDDLYQSTFGFSANPCLCNTQTVKRGFRLLNDAPKGDKLGFDGFENFLTRTFDAENIKCIIVDPVDHLSISHEGYLESTPRNWHMTNSLESRTKEHLLTMATPSFFRRMLMAVKLAGAFLKLFFTQFFNDRVYELCFRIIASVKTVNKDE